MVALLYRLMIVCALAGITGLPASAQQQLIEDAEPPDPLVHELRETIVRVPITVPLLSGARHSGEFIITHFRPAGTGPFPAVLVNHGRAMAGRRGDVARMRLLPVVRFWTKRGYAVFVPTRLGYGETGTEPDPEYGGPCDRRNHKHTATAAGMQIVRTVELAREQSWVKRDHIVLTGASVGGLATTHVNGLRVPGVIAAVNFAGGAGGNPKNKPGQPCDPSGIGQVYAKAGGGRGAPMLWIYVENDQYWGPRLPREWHKSYVDAGGRAEMVVLPPIGKDGHRVMTIAQRQWAPLVDAFLATIAAPKR